MVYQLNNQQPQKFYRGQLFLPLIDPSLDKDTFAEYIYQHLKGLLINPIFMAKDPKHPVTIVETEQNQEVDEETFSKATIDYLSNSRFDPNLNLQLKDLFNQGHQYDLTGEMTIDQLMIMELLQNHQLPYPERNAVIYTQEEVIEAAAGLSNGLLTDKTYWSAMIGAYVHSFGLKNFALFTVHDEKAIDKLKDSLDVYIQNNSVDPETVQHINDFKKLNLKNQIHGAVFLPGEDRFKANSFHRILNYELAILSGSEYAPIDAEPFSLSSTIAPSKIVFINLKEFAKAQDIQGEWARIAKAFNNTFKLKDITNKRIQTLEEMDTKPTPIEYFGGGSDDELTKRKALDFVNKQPMKTNQIVKRLKKIFDKRRFNMRTSNVTKSHRKTFMRQNRRNPDNIDLQGVATTSTYSSDFHIWLDTSGSISIDDYEKQLNLLALLAKKLKVNMYFNSFSHYVSETNFINIQAMPPQQVVQHIEQIPKVSGGTNFLNVWQAIDKIETTNKKKQQAPRLHIIISDMDYYLEKDYIMQASQPSVKDTYYIPIRLQDDYQRRQLQLFADSIAIKTSKQYAYDHLLY